MAKCKCKYTCTGFTTKGKTLYLVFKCAHCTKEKQRKASLTEKEFFMAEELEYETVRKVQTDFFWTFLQEDGKSFKKIGYTLLQEVLEWSKTHKDHTRVTTVSDDDFADSFLVFIDLKSDQSYFGTQVVYIPQCAGTPQTFFLYPESLLELQTTLKDLVRSYTLLAKKEAQRKHRRLQEMRKWVLLDSLSRKCFKMLSVPRLVIARFKRALDPSNILSDLAHTAPKDNLYSQYNSKVLSKVLAKNPQLFRKTMQQLARLLEERLQVIETVKSILPKLSGHDALKEAYKKVYRMLAWTLIGHVEDHGDLNMIPEDLDILLRKHDAMYLGLVDALLLDY